MRSPGQSPFGPVAALRAVLFIAALLATLYYGIVAEFHVPHAWRWIERPDLMLHLAAFGACAFLAPHTGRLRMPVLVLLGLVAALIELAQFYEKERTASLVDFSAGIAGIGLGWLAGRAVGWFADRHCR
jgi:VanZ family protein